MEKERDIIIDINHYRALGRVYCETKGSEHYEDIREDGGIDAIEIAILNNTFEDFAVTNVLKYILRWKKTRNPEDLKKVVDYGHILCGVELNYLYGKTKEGKDVSDEVEDYR